MEPPRSDIIVLIPAYNEELTITSIVMLSKKFSDRVIVVDDGSRDRTSELAIMAGAEVIRSETNMGKAEALMTGFQRCRELHTKCIVMIDGDGQMDPALIPQITAPVLKGEADLVIGSRFLGDDLKNIPRYRKLGLWVLNRVVNFSSSSNITDSQSGYRALSHSALDNITLNSNKYNIESDMIIHLQEKGMRIVEVPVSIRYDVPNGHKQTPTHQGLSVMGHIVSYIGYRHPLIIFGVPGTFFFLMGGFICMATFIEWPILFNWTLVSQGIAGTVILGIGIFLMFAALMLNSLALLMSNLKMIREEKKRMT